jgi:hypothetical protein
VLLSCGLQSGFDVIEIALLIQTILADESKQKQPKATKINQK